MTLKNFTSVPDDRAVDEGDPAGDMNETSLQLSEVLGASYSILNTAWAGGAKLDGSSDSTAAIQACMDAAAAAGQPVLIPAGIQFRVSSLTWNAGQVLQGVYSGTFPGDDTITTASVLSRLASTNEDLIVVPDGTNYGGIYDLAIDGNKSQNSSGMGINIQDGASGQECQIRVERCFIHDNPGDNIYLGNNRRANHLLNSAFNQSGSGSGITVAGSDNKIGYCIAGSNAQAGIRIGTNASTHFSAYGSPFASDVTTVFGCDIFLNDVGVSISQYAVQAVVIGNGIDRNSYEGITVYDGDTHQIMGNCLHTNGQATTNTYGHIDVASGVTQVGIANNTFGPLDSGYSNLPSYCVVTHANPSIGAILGNIGVMDSGSATGGLITTAAAASPPQTVAAKTGVTIQGSGGEDILRLVRSGGSVVLKMTQGGVAVWSSPFQMTPQSSPVPVSGEGVLYVSSTDYGPHYIAPSGEGGADVNLISGAFLCSPSQYAPSQTQLTTPAATTVAAGSNGGEISAIASWSSPSAGVLDVASTTGWPAVGGTVNVAASGSTTAVVTYTGISGNSLTGCAYVSGSATGTVATGGAVTLISLAPVSSGNASTGSFTAPPSGDVIVTAYFAAEVSAAADAVGFGLAAHGTTSPQVGYFQVVKLTVNPQPYIVPWLVTGLTPGTSYNYDLMWNIASGGTATIYACGQNPSAPTYGAGEYGAPIVMTVTAV